MTKEEYTKEFIMILDIYKDSNMALNKNLVQLTTKYILSLEKRIEELELPKNNGIASLCIQKINASKMMGIIK